MRQCMMIIRGVVIMRQELQLPIIQQELRIAQYWTRILSVVSMTRVRVRHRVLQILLCLSCVHAVALPLHDSLLQFLRMLPSRGNLYRCAHILTTSTTYQFGWKIIAMESGRRSVSTTCKSGNTYSLAAWGSTS